MRHKKYQREKNNNIKSPNNNLLRQYASIIKMLVRVCVCVCKQLKMNGQKKKSNKQTATATTTATAKRHLNDTFCGENNNRHTKWSHTPAEAP